MMEKNFIENKFWWKKIDAKQFWWIKIDEKKLMASEMSWTPRRGGGQIGPVFISQSTLLYQWWKKIDEKNFDEKNLMKKKFDEKKLMKRNW